MRRLRITQLAMIVIAIALAWSVPAFAQAAAQAAAAPKPETLAGTYQGTATTPDGQLPVTITVKADKGSLTGTIDHGQGAVVSITGGTIAGDKVTFTIDMGGTPGTITGTVKGDRIEGTWTAGDANGTFNVTKSTDAPDAAPANPADAKPANAAAEAKPGAPAAGDPLTGAWDGITGNGEMSVPFTLNLKLEGEKVTGDISSEQGGAALNPGVWKDGALSISFDFSGMGTVTMIGALKEGKLIGTMDFAGQMQMSWAAVRK